MMKLTMSRKVGKKMHNHKGVGSEEKKRTHMKRMQNKKE
jgi:hypothetical protein